MHMGHVLTAAHQDLTRLTPELGRDFDNLFRIFTCQGAVAYLKRCKEVRKALYMHWQGTEPYAPSLFRSAVRSEDVTLTFSMLQALSLFLKVQLPEIVKPSELESFMSRLPRSSSIIAGQDSLLSRTIPDLQWTELRFKTATGACYERVKPHERCDLSEYWFPDPRWREVFSHPLQLGVRQSMTFTGTSRACQVPKDFDRDRLIFIEEYGRQALQQSLMLYLYDKVHSSRLSKYTRFEDQTYNSNLILGRDATQWATIDLSNASDSIGVSQIYKLTRKLPYLRSALLHSRPKSVDGHSTTVFNTMGCGTCFPMMTIFISTALHRVFEDAHLPLEFRVYGDDIVVPLTHVDHAIAALSALGFTPNMNKTFSKGPYRETCGVESFMGHDVTPLRIRHLDHHRGRIVAYSNQAYLRGMYNLSDYFRSLVPAVGLHPEGYISRSGMTDYPTRYHAGYHNHQVLVPRSVVCKGARGDKTLAHLHAALGMGSKVVSDGGRSASKPTELAWASVAG